MNALQFVSLEDNEDQNSQDSTNSGQNLESECFESIRDTVLGMFSDSQPKTQEREIQQHYMPQSRYGSAPQTYEMSHQNLNQKSVEYWRAQCNLLEQKVQEFYNHIDRNVLDSQYHEFKTQFRGSIHHYLKAAKKHNLSSAQLSLMARYLLIRQNAEFCAATYKALLRSSGLQYHSYQRNINEPYENMQDNDNIYYGPDKYVSKGRFKEGTPSYMADTVLLVDHAIQFIYNCEDARKSRENCSAEERESSAAFLDKQFKTLRAVALRIREESGYNNKSERERKLILNEIFGYIVSIASTTKKTNASLPEIITFLYSQKDENADLAIQKFGNTIVGLKVAAEVISEAFGFNLK